MRPRLLGWIFAGAHGPGITPHGPFKIQHDVSNLIAWNASRYLLLVRLPDSASPEGRPISRHQVITEDIPTDLPINKQGHLWSALPREFGKAPVVRNPFRILVRIRSPGNRSQYP